MQRTNTTARTVSPSRTAVSTAMSTTPYRGRLESAAVSTGVGGMLVPFRISVRFTGTRTEGSLSSMKVFLALTWRMVSEVKCYSTVELVLSDRVWAKKSGLCIEVVF